MRALIVTDLEGVHGADRVEALVGGSDAWKTARLRATHEVNLVIAGLAKQGFGEFVVSDSHRNGSEEPNLVLEALDARATYDFRADAFAAPLIGRASAVAALGMHVAGGRPGFISHSLDVGLAWELEGRLLSETDFLLGLCAEAGVPFLFVTGDDALVNSLPEGTAGVVVKNARSAVSATSLPLDVVEEALVRAAFARPRPAASLPEGPLRMHVKSENFEVPDLDFLERQSEFTVLVHGDSLRSRYTNALVAIDAASSASNDFIHAEVGAPGFVDEVAAFLSAPWPSLAR